MSRLEAMEIFVAAVDAGSLSAASRQLKIPLATVSRRISDLEDSLNVRLLLRGARKLALTEAGRTYLAACRRILDDVAEAERAATGEYQAPRGELVLTAPQVMGRVHVMPVVAEFLEAYPEIRMRVQLSDRKANFLDDHVDLALRAGALPDSSLIAIRAGHFRRVLCASPAYLARRGHPEKPADLAHHTCIGYESPLSTTSWDFGKAGNIETIGIEPRLVVNTVEAAVSAALADAGVARVTTYLIDDHVRSGQLVTLLERFEPAPIPVSFIYPAQRQVPLKLRAFLDFAAPRLRARLGD